MFINQSSNQPSSSLFSLFISLLLLLLLFSYYFFYPVFLSSRKRKKERKKWTVYVSYEEREGSVITTPRLFIPSPHSFHHFYHLSLFFFFTSRSVARWSCRRAFYVSISIILFRNFFLPASFLLPTSYFLTSSYLVSRLISIEVLHNLAHSFLFHCSLLPCRPRTCFFF